MDKDSWDEIIMAVTPLMLAFIGCLSSVIIALALAKSDINSDTKNVLFSAAIGLAGTSIGSAAGLSSPKPSRKNDDTI